ncbi:MAG: DUF6268 family outer membrane beta-barrel protein [Phycisphaerales bacterium]|nr:DUF6268 family outer membrane beta-barrel protein [Phycisphaerales bacterium]
MLIPTLCAALVTTAPFAQETPDQTVAAETPGQDAAAPFSMDWTVRGGFAYQLRSTLKAGGRVDWTRAHADVKGRMPFSDDLELLVGVRYQYDRFGFRDATAAGNPFDPFDSVNTVQLDGALQYKATQRWMIFGGGQAIFSAAKGAAFSDAITGGGVIGAVYSFDKDLSVGGGVGVRSRILDNVLIYPVIVVNWNITDKLTFTTRLTSGWGNRTGGQLVYQLSEGVRIGVAGIFDYQRFRLSDDNTVAPGGAGTTEALPIAAFITFDVCEQGSLSAFIGANVMGRTKVTDVGRNDVWASTYETTPMLGLQGTIRF